VIEIDGDHHASQVEADGRRTAAMEREGWRVLRFWANHVVQNPEGIWTEIALVLGDGGQPPHPASYGSLSVKGIITFGQSFLVRPRTVSSSRPTGEWMRCAQRRSRAGRRATAAGGAKRP